jgi:hypothetical protein
LASDFGCNFATWPATSAGEFGRDFATLAGNFAALVGDFGWRLRPATSASDFGWRLWPATLALDGDFGWRLWLATLAGDFGFGRRLWPVTLAGEFGRDFAPLAGDFATLACDFGRRLRPATLAGNFGRRLRNLCDNEVRVAILTLHRPKKPFSALVEIIATLPKSD